jgi:ferredoxin-NADP reductase
MSGDNEMTALTGSVDGIGSNPQNNVNPVFREHEDDLVISGKEAVADDVAVLTLASPTGSVLPEWTPGAHIDLVLGPSLVRQYSLCGRPDESGTYRIGVLRDPNSRGGSQHVHEILQLGSTVRVRGPRNHFALVRSPRYVFVAGGIGITPILAMLRTAHAWGADWTLLYGGRQRSSMAFLDELATYGDRVSVQPQDEVGLMDLKSMLGTPMADTLVYCCGPEPLLAAVERSCEGWLAGSLHIERFAPKRLPERTEAVKPFEVIFHRSGITAAVPPDQSILDVAEESGLPILSSCREGTCGTCETGVIEGDPEHRDSLLTPEEQQAGDVMMICVSRSRSPRLVLDL